MQHASPNPRISRLAPLDVALARLAALTPPACPRQRKVAEAAGAVLAADIHALADLPSSPIAHADGWAVAAEDVAGASAYSPAVLAPAPQWVEAGDPIPDATDAVLPPEGLSIAAPGMPEASLSVAPGEGVRRAGQDIAAGSLLVAQGTRLAPRHLGILRARGIETVSVRIPRVRLVLAGAAATPQLDLVGPWLEAAGAEIADTVSAPGDRAKLATAYAAPGANLVVSLGGTGQGRSDCAVVALADAGEAAVHGIALRPGASAAFGTAGGIPVLLLPGRVDAVVACLLVLAKQALARISGLTPEPAWSAPMRLTDKASSAIGFTELFLGLPQGDAIEGDAVEPVPLDEAGLDVLARAAGWFTVPPGSEGLAAGEVVHLSPFHTR